MSRTLAGFPERKQIPVALAGLELAFRFVTAMPRTPARFVTLAFGKPHECLLDAFFDDESGPPSAIGPAVREQFDGVDVGENLWPRSLRRETFKPRAEGNQGGEPHTSLCFTSAISSVVDSWGIVPVRSTRPP